MNQQHHILDALISAYEQVGVPADKLPYTPEFDKLHELVEEKTNTNLAPNQCWQLLTNARKRGLLPRLCR